MKTLLIICLAAAIGLTACSVTSNLQPLQVPVSYAPKLNFGRDSTTILLVNHYDFAPRKLHSKMKLAVLKGVAYTTLASAARELGYLHGVKAINLADSVSFSVDTDSVSRLAHRYKADYVLALEDFWADIDEEIYLHSGEKRIAYSSTVNVNFMLYESNALYSKKLEGKASDLLRDELYGNFLGSLITAPSIKKNGDPLKRSARNAALNALQDYLPFTVTRYRQLYNDNDSLKKAVGYIYNKQYKEAFDILNPLIDGPDSKQASHAAFNLAVVYEAQGDIEAALEAARLSNQKQQNEYATSLITQLEDERGASPVFRN